MKRWRQKTEAGFTLIDLLITIVVISVGLIGIISFFNINLSSQFEAKNELIAASLAQEGVDFVRNIKDFNQLNPALPLRSKWYNYLNDNTGDDRGDLCKTVGPDSLSVHYCLNDETKSYVCRSADWDGEYDQCKADNPDRTVMQRTVTVLRKGGDLDTGGYLEVTSKVTWNGRTTTAKDFLYNNSY